MAVLQAQHAAFAQDERSLAPLEDEQEFRFDR